MLICFILMMSSMGPVAAAGMNDSGVESVETENYSVQNLNFTGSAPSNSSNPSVNSEISNDSRTSTFPDLKTKGSKEGLVDPKVFVISSDANIKSINDAAYKVMELLNPVGNYDAPVSFEVRSYKQIEAMNDSDLKALIESSQIVIGEWISDTVNKKLWNLVSTNKGLLNDKDFLMVDYQGTTSNLTRMNQVNGKKIFSGLSDSELSSLRLVVKNSNTTALETYRSRWSNSSSPQYNPECVEWIDMALCYTQKGTQNFENQFKYSIKGYEISHGGSWDSSWDPEPCILTKKEMLYRDGKTFNSLEDYLKIYSKNSSAPTVGIVDDVSYVTNGNMDHYQSLIDTLVARGFNVIPIVGSSGASVQTAMATFFTDPQNKVNAVVSFFDFTLGNNNTNTLLESLNVPVFKAMRTDKRTEGDWLVSQEGLPWNEVYYKIANAETQGIIEPTFVAASETVIDPVTGAQISRFKPVTERINTLSDRITSWVNLQTMGNSDKKIAMIYYNYPPGKQNIGASYLNVPESIMNILQTLKAQNYTVENIPNNSTQLVDEMIKRGINVANWAPGELEKLAENPNTILWEADKYKAWLAKQDPLVQKEVFEGPTGYIEELTKIGISNGSTDATLTAIDKWTNQTKSLADTYTDKSAKADVLLERMNTALKAIINGDSTKWNDFYAAKADFRALNMSGLSGWGEAPGNIMTVKKNGTEYIVIPGMFFGNIYIGPEPQRGWEADVEKLYHNTAVSPPHQYLAWYAWVNEVFGADAQVHLGRHATYEWLPRKEVALTRFDYSDVVSGDVPSIYIYSMDGVAEGLQSKRRGNAVIIDHLIPPMNSTALYGNYTVLKTSMDNYKLHSADPDGSQLKEQYKTEISNNVVKLNLAGELGIVNPKNLTDADITKIDDFLDEMEGTLTPYGLHTFGGNWSSEEIDMMAKAMAAVNGGNIDDYRKLLSESPTYELNSLLGALNGSYVSPATGNDPINNVNALPTGKNFYLTNDNQLPKKSAWELGKKLADMALAQFDQKDLPEKIAAVVWCVETSRDDGTMASFVLRMLGVEPEKTEKWLNQGGTVGKMVATPSSELTSDLNKTRVEMGLSPLPANYTRPRIDVITTTSGLFRDLFPKLLVNMDRSYRVALAASYKTICSDPKYSNLKDSLDYALQPLVTAGYSTKATFPTGIYGNESLETNYIAKHWLQTVQDLKTKGVSSNDAGELAITRIFSDAVGEYGAGVSKAVEQSWTWNSTDTIADMYLERMGHSYTERNWGTPNTDLFKDLLKGVGTAYHSRSSNVYGVLDNDDFFDYFGGLSLAIKRANDGRAPDLNVLSYANRNNARVMSLENYMGMELRTRYLNPQWIQGMMGEGYSGAREMSNKFISNLWGWQVTNPELVKGWMWDEAVKTYLKDQYNTGVTKWLSTGNNAYSMISMTGTMLTAAYKGYWKPDTATMKLVANTWAQMVIQNGVACCDCSCGNIAMMKWATQYINPDMLAQVKSKLYTATGSAAFAASTSTSNPSSSQGSQGSTANTGSTAVGTSSSASTGAGESSSQSSNHGSSSSQAGDNGQKSYEITKNNGSSSSQTGMPVAAILGIIVLVGLVGVGYFKGRR